MKNRFKGLVDVCGGPMTLEHLEWELNHYFHDAGYNPQRLIIDIQRRPGKRVYDEQFQATVYMTKEDFER